MNFCQVVSTTVYLDNLADTQEFDDVYGKFFPDALPARTTLQQIAPGDRNPDKELRYPDLEQMSLIAVKKNCHAKQ
jgi:enamine deaminase RidA (YjgF/YER057c/UK114 family)